MAEEPDQNLMKRRISENRRSVRYRRAIQTMTPCRPTLPAGSRNPPAIRRNPRERSRNGRCRRRVSLPSAIPKGRTPENTRVTIIPVPRRGHRPMRGGAQFTYCHWVCGTVAGKRYGFVALM